MIPGFGEIAERLRRATVQITIGRRRAWGGGSGVIWTTDGTIITNSHVVTRDEADVELWDGRSYPARVASRDLRRDLAELRIQALDLPAAMAGDSDALRVGELAVAVGNPFGFTGALTTGVIHALAPVPRLGRLPWVQADVRLAPGNSGGPLADARGHVIGVNTMIAGGIALAVPSNAVKRFVASGASTAALGVVLRPLWLRRAGRQFGLMILEIQPGMSAERASLLPGDIITGVNGKRLESVDELRDALENLQNPVLRLQFLRGGRPNPREVAVELIQGRAEAA